VNRKAISLLSGGLDSTLSTKLILDQGVDVVALNFTSPFSSKREKERGLQAVRTAKELGIRLVLKEKGPEYIDMIRSPKYGYGKNVNPCIDCRIFMLRKTKEIMAEEGASFVVTGEVLGQRPMSQRRDTIQVIERASGLEGLIVRPLSAMHFLPTIPEREGLIDRAQMLDIAGRGRGKQYELVEKYKLNEFGSPGGGCLLTDPIFAVKLKDLFAQSTDFADFTPKDIELLSIGRHFRLRPDTKLIVGRNEGENERLFALWEEPYVLFQPADFTGPSAILKGSLDSEVMNIAANMIGHYGKHTTATVTVELKGSDRDLFTVAKIEINPDDYKI
jgi:tRNA-uridine 2-sulfurtransferase